MTTDTPSLNAAPHRAVSERPEPTLRPSQHRLRSHRSLQHTLAHYFLNSSAVLLAAFAGALFSCNLARASLVAPHEPVTALPITAVFWILGATALAVAVASVYTRHRRSRLALVLWFATSVIIFRVGLASLGIHGITGYIAGLAHTLGLSNGCTTSLLAFLFAYVFIGSAVLLLWDCLAGPEEPEPKPPA